MGGSLIILWYCDVIKPPPLLLWVPPTGPTYWRTPTERDVIASSPSGWAVGWRHPSPAPSASLAFPSGWSMHKWNDGAALPFSLPSSSCSHFPAMSFKCSLRVDFSFIHLKSIEGFRPRGAHSGNRIAQRHLHTSWNVEAQSSQHWRHQFCIFLPVGGGGGEVGGGRWEAGGRLKFHPFTSFAYIGRHLISLRCCCHFRFFLSVGSP